MEWWWSWLLTIIGVSGLWIAGSGKRWGWAVNLAAQALWITYAVVTQQWGFIPGSLCYAAVYLRNWRRKSRREE